MSKKDLFVIIYCCTWGSLSVILLCILCYWLKIVDPSTYVFASNMAFLAVTSSFVFIKPVRRFVDKHIIEKLP